MRKRLCYYFILAALVLLLLSCVSAGVKSVGDYTVLQGYKKIAFVQFSIANPTYPAVYVNIDVTSSLKKNHAAFFLLRIFCRVSREGFKYTVWIMFHCFGGLLHRDGFDWYAA